MMDKHLSHIRVLLAGPTPPAHLVQDLPVLNEEFLASEDADPAGTVKDPTDGATDDPDASYIPEHDTSTKGGDLDVDTTQNWSHAFAF